MNFFDQRFQLTKNTDFILLRSGRQFIKIKKLIVVLIYRYGKTPKNKQITL